MKNTSALGRIVLQSLFLFAGISGGTAFAQSGMAGVVKDTTGAVMPGVTVEAASPALIEKVRSVTTDTDGQYKLIDLRPGVYLVTFSLPGFTTIRREGIELPASFTATVNAELRVGGVEETLTVSGAAPLVDVQNVTQRKVMNQEVLDNLPSTRGPEAFTAFVPGVVTLSVGDTMGRDQKSLSIHDSRTGEQTTTIDGFSTRMTRGVGGTSSTFYVNQANVAEISVQTGGLSAEQQSAGLWTNVIPKEGSNTLSGYVYGAYSGSTLVSDNLTPKLQSLGLSGTNPLRQSWDGNGAAGGKLIHDKLWFYSAYRNAGVSEYLTSLYYNSTPTGWMYTPDKSRPAYVEITDGSYATRLTWQASPKNKINVYYDLQPHIVHQRNYSSTVSPEATTYTPYQPNYFAQVVWKSPVTNKLLLEAGVGGTDDDYNPRLQAGVDPSIVSATELTTGVVFRAPTTSTTPGYQDSAPGHHINRQATMRASASYITGSHAFKAGISLLRGTNIDTLTPSGNMVIQLLDAAPSRIVEVAAPYEMNMRINADLGAFLQDQWTVSRFTINAGLRFDYLNASDLPVDQPAGTFVPARSLPGVDCVPCFKDLSPRLGVSYDIRGDGRTAVKATLNRYVAGYGTELAVLNNPVTTSVETVTRNWTDSNGNFSPDCDLTNPAAQNLVASGGDNCGAISDTNFGKNNPKATVYDPAILNGWGARVYNWEASASVEHELTGGVSLIGTYFRRWYGNFTVTDNQLVSPSDYDPYCITGPVNAGLPNGGGNQLCGYYDVSPTKFGLVQNVVTSADKFGKQAEVYNGVDVTATARLPRGIHLSGGVSTGRTETNNCLVVDSPQQLLFCDVKPPFQPNVKAYVIYPLLWDIQASAVVQSVPGGAIAANYTATNALIAPSLKRNLASGATGTATVPLMQPGQVYEPRVNQLDLRATKSVRAGRTRIMGMVDVFNVFNGSGISSLNATYGAQWLQPTRVQGSRYVKFSAQLTF